MPYGTDDSEWKDAVGLSEGQKAAEHEKITCRTNHPDSVIGGFILVLSGDRNGNGELRKKRSEDRKNDLRPDPQIPPNDIRRETHGTEGVPWLPTLPP